MTDLILMTMELTFAKKRTAVTCMALRRFPHSNLDSKTSDVLTLTLRRSSRSEALNSKCTKNGTKSQNSTRF